MSRLNGLGRLFALVFMASGVLFAGSAREAAAAVKHVSGTIPAGTDAVWDTVGGRFYEVTGSVTVQLGASLTIAPGVVVKFDAYQGLFVNGRLTAVGGAGPDSTIYFTSILDDNIPPPFGDDTNGDGSATHPAAQNWTGIHFYSDADDASHLSHCEFWFGGASYYAGSYFYGVIGCDNANPTIEDCVINAGYYGIQCTGVAAPTIHNVDVSACLSVPLAISLAANPVFDSVTFGSTSDNGFDAIGLLGGELTTNGTLPVRGTTFGGSPITNVTYLLLNSLTVNSGAMLTIDPGVVIKVNPSAVIAVFGTFNAIGTTGSPIVFTSVKDDNFGDPNDTNNDGSSTAPAIGDWSGFYFGSGAAGSLDYCVARYGTNYGGYGSLIHMLDVGTSVAVTNCQLSDSHYGLELGGLSDPAVTGTSISNCSHTPILMSVAANPSLADLTFNTNGITALGLISETVSVNSTLRRRDVAGFNNITYYLVGALVMDVGTTLTLEPGVVVKTSSSPYNEITIRGGLLAQGTVDDEIVFTSERDDTHGNPPDTNGDGSATSPTSSDWGGIIFAATAIDPSCQLVHCWIGYAYGSYDYYYAGAMGAVRCVSAAPTIDQCTFYTDYCGVRCDGAADPVVTNCHFFNNGSVPIIQSVLAHPTFTNNTFDQNAYHAVGIQAETISQEATLDVSTVGVPQFAEAFPYYLVEGSLSVGTGNTLHIQPGVVVKSSAYAILVNGGLVAEPPVAGTPPVVFTEIRDDSHGGDSNVNGSADSPAAGGWSGIQFNTSADDANCRLNNCEFWYGGSGSYTSAGSAAIVMDSASPSIANCSFEFNRTGIWMRGASSPTISGNLIRQSSVEPIVLDLLSTPVFGATTFDGNGVTALGILGGTLAQNATLPVRSVAGYDNITYVLHNDLTVAFGATLTIAPGVVLKFYPFYPFYLGGQITVNGALTAIGDAVNPVVFTSVRDDEVGNPLDTNGDGSLTSPTPGDWHMISFADVSDDAHCNLDHCMLRYGGSYYYYYYNGPILRMDSASPTVSNCIIERSAGVGAQLEGVSDPIFQTSRFVRCGTAPVAMTLQSDPTITGCTFEQNGYTALGIIGQTLAQDVTWIKRDAAGIRNIPYVLMSDLTVGTAATLTMEPGLVVKMGGSGLGTTIHVQRGLIAEGGSSPDSLIVFTSVADDFYGGDTNVDSTATTGASRTWSQIVVESTAQSANVRFAHCVFSYSYAYDGYGAVAVKGSASPNFTNCVFAHNGIGINYQEASGDSTIGRVVNCDFFDNSYYAIKNTGHAHTIWAEGSWWGDPSGPLDNSDDTASGGLFNPSGQGDPVTDDVDYYGFDTHGLVTYLLGDVSLTGGIHAYDASLILRALVADTTLTVQQAVAADVNCSGDYSTLDASYILQFVAGMVPYFPCESESTLLRLHLAAPPVWPGTTPGRFEVSLDDFDLGAAGEIQLPLRLTGDGDIYGIRVELASASPALEIKGVSAAPGLAGALFTSKIGADGRLRLAIASASKIPAGLIGTVTVASVEAPAVSPDDAGDAEVAVTFVRAVVNEQDVTQTARGGRGTRTPALPVAFSLAQNTPNPCSQGTTIRFGIPGSAGASVPTTLEITDVAGRRVRLLVDEVRGPGFHEVRWDGRDAGGRPAASGMYFYRLRAGGFAETRKMLLFQ